MGAGVVGGDLEAGDRFGSALAAGDFGRTAKGRDADDLAIGVPFEDLGSFFGASDAGAVDVLCESPTLFSAGGLTAASGQFLHQCTSGCSHVGDEPAESGDSFGSSLAAADFGMDGQDDLAVGVPYEGTASGAIDVFYGARTRGLLVDGHRTITQDSTVDADSSEPGDLFGWSLAGGDLDGDGFAELAVGAPSEDVGSEANAGAVDVIDGSSTGLDMMSSQFWTQDDLGAVSEAGDDFGWSLAIGDFGGSAHGDLAVGAPFETLQELQDPIVAAGGVNVIDGSANGLTDIGTQFWSQDTLTVLNDAERDDLFGFALSAADFGNGPHADLAVGVSSEDTPVGNAGALNVLYGADTGLTDLGNQLWTQDAPGILDTDESDDQFGEVLVNDSVGRQPVILS